MALANATNTILISIVGVDYPTLKMTKDNIKIVSGVQTVDMTFSAGSSSLSVNYTGKADQLWEALPNSITGRYNLIKLDNNTISAEFKK